MKSVGNVDYVKQTISPNGSILKIFAASGSYFLQLFGFAKAAGYKSFNFRSSFGAALDAKNSDGFLYYGFNKLARIGKDKTYLINFADVEKILNRLIKIVNFLPANNFQREQKNREVQFEAQRLIEWFNEKILPEFLPHLCKTQTSTNLFDEQSENETEEQKMFENENAIAEESRADEIQSEVENNSAEKVSLKLPVKIPALTKDDLVDIADRADFVKETFDVNKRDALRAVVLLKSQEINRDLSPLLALLKSV